MSMNVYGCTEQFLFLTSGTSVQGVLFEISYALGLRDAASRKFLVSNAGTLCRATGGKHVLLSSGARSPMVSITYVFRRNEIAPLDS